MSKIFLFQVIQFSQVVIIQTIQFSISIQFDSIEAQLGGIIPGQSEPGSNGNEGVLYIPQSSSIIGTSPSDYLVSYQDTRCGGGLTPLQSWSLCILQPQPTGQWDFRKISKTMVNTSATPSHLQNYHSVADWNDICFEQLEVYCLNKFYNDVLFFAGLWLHTYIQI